MLKKISFLMLILFLIPNISYSEIKITSEKADVLEIKKIKEEILNNVSHEYVTCAAYFFFSSEALRQPNNSDGATKYEKLRNLAMQLALTTAMEGRTQEMAEKVVMARLDLEMKRMLNEINGNISNISILMNKYHLRCKRAMEDPNSLLLEWTNRILKKYQLN